MTIASGQVSVNFQASPVKEIASGIQNASAQGRINKSWAISVGTVVDKADEMYTAVLSIAASGSQTLDLSALVDAFGDTITLARIKAMIIVNKSVVDSINVGGATNAWEGWITAAGEIIVPASTSNYQSWFGFAVPDAAAYPVTAATDDELKITNNDTVNTTEVEIMIIGASA